MRQGDWQRQPIARLPDAVIHQIAAGEAITGAPAVLKELIENALDAGAQEVWIEVRGGGIDAILVGDDGCGIAPDDLSLAITPHATSKIRATVDLAHVATLGFRGEALASIAAVAAIEVVSATAGATGARLLAGPGQAVSTRPAARTRGTTVQVRDLFAAQPVRRKIVAETTGQNRVLSTLVQRYALAWPSVRFSLKLEGKPVFQSSGLGSSSALAAVFGTRQDRLQAAGPIEVASAVISAHVADPGFTRGDQSGLLFVVNGRPVSPTRWLGALESAYRSVLPARRHPIAVFTLAIDPARIDANIHPAKLEIRIQDEEQVLAASSAMLKDVLSHVPADARTILDSVRSRHQTTLPRPRRTLREGRAAYGGSVDLRSVRIIGQLLHTAIIAETPGGLVLIDQHRAEERAIFESLAQKAAAPLAQDLLIPLQIEVQAQHEPAARAVLDELAARGFRLEWFGPRRLLVRSLPSGLPAVAAEGLTEALQAKDLRDNQVLEAVLISVSCRAAVRRSVPLTMAEMEQLVARLAACEVQSMCPHGSPIVARLEAGELARHFGWP